MERNRIPKPGELYLHFKGKPYQIITVATHTETNEAMVVYQALYGNFKTYVRPLNMFLSEVDREKYPEIQQKYRFELWIPESEDTRDVINNNTSAVHIQKKNAEQLTRQEEISDDLPKDSVDIQENVLETGEVNSLLLKFLDADSYTKKLEVLTSNKKHMNDRLINDMAVSLDCTVDEGPLDQRIQALINCLEAMRRFEDRRLR